MQYIYIHGFGKQAVFVNQGAQGKCNNEIIVLHGKMSHLFGKRANSTLHSIKCSLHCGPVHMLQFNIMQSLLK